jgi:thiamine biosynthesis lipoprotein
MYLPPKLRRAATVLLLLVLAGAGCAKSSGAALGRHEYAQLHMGVQARLIVYAASPQKAAAAAKAAYARVAEIEQIASDYRPTSELMQLCRNAGEGPVKVSPELFALLSFSQDLARRSGGAFDVTVGPYVQLWRAARKTRQLPPAEELERARAVVGWQKVKLDREHRAVELALPGMRLDLGGIAKGYAGDEALRVLRAHGIRSALFEAGGDIVVGDAPPDALGWSIEVVGDAATTSRTPWLVNAAISTSGDTEQYVEIDGMRYSHVVDPRTGLGLTQRYVATVIARDGMTSDALSTAATVMGEEGKRLEKSYRGTRVYVRKAPVPSPGTPGEG